MKVQPQARERICLSLKASTGFGSRQTSVLALPRAETMMRFFLRTLGSRGSFSLAVTTGGLAMSRAGDSTSGRVLSVGGGGIPSCP